MSSMSGIAVVPGMVIFSIPQTLLSGFTGLGTLLRRKVLWHEIFGHIRHAEFVSPTIHHRVARTKIIGGRRRGHAPLECGGAPGIAFQNAFAAPQAPQKIDEEDSLREHGEQNREGDERANRI